MFLDFEDETKRVTIGFSILDDIVMTDDKFYKGRNIFSHIFPSEQTQLNHVEMLKTIPDSKLVYRVFTSFYQRTANILLKFNIGITSNDGNVPVPVEAS